MPSESPEKKKFSSGDTRPRMTSESRSHATRRIRPVGIQILNAADGSTRRAPSTGPSDALFAQVDAGAPIPSTKAVATARMSARIAHPLEEVDLLPVRRRKQPSQRRIRRIVPDGVAKLGNRDVDRPEVTLERARELWPQGGALELEMIE